MRLEGAIENAFHEDAISVTLPGHVPPGYLSDLPRYDRISTYPSVPCMRMRRPSRISRGGVLHAYDGRPYSYVFRR